MIYADRMVDCWGLVSFEEFLEKVRSGWVATELEDGARASAHEVASWTMTEPLAWVDADELIAEVADDIERLNGRPTSGDRCLDAAEAYVDEPTEENRLALRAAYEAVPGHHRIYLGDMDHRDVPVLTLMTPVGERLYDNDEGEPVTAEDHAWAREYFLEGRRARSPEERRRWDDPERPAGDRPTVIRQCRRPLLAVTRQPAPGRDRGTDLSHREKSPVKRPGRGVQVHRSTRSCRTVPACNNRYWMSRGSWAIPSRTDPLPSVVRHSSNVPPHRKKALGRHLPDVRPRAVL